MYTFCSGIVHCPCGDGTGGHWAKNDEIGTRSSSITSGTGVAEAPGG